MQSFFRGKKVLVAGGSGMIGQCAVRKCLDQGAYVRATQFNSTLSIRHPNLEVITCDLRDRSLTGSVFKNIDIVLLCAGKVRGAKFIVEDPTSFIMYNLDLISWLIYQATQANVGICGFISSSYVYPDTGNPNLEHEGFEGDPGLHSNYGNGWYHRYLETLCKHFHRTTDTRFTVVRPAALYGPHDNFDLDEGHVIPGSIVKAVDRMDPYEVWGDGKEIRCFTHVDDFVDGFMLAIEKYAIAEPINICQSESTTVYDAINIILKTLDFSPVLKFNLDKPIAIKYKVSDSSKAQEVLGWKAQINLEEGIRQTVEWYQEHRSL